MRNGVTLERLEGCARCGGVHEMLEFTRMVQPIQNEDGDLQYWAPCPVTGDPILMHVDPVVSFIPDDGGRLIPWDSFDVSTEL